MANDSQLTVKQLTLAEPTKIPGCLPKKQKNANTMKCHVKFSGNVTCQCTHYALSTKQQSCVVHQHIG